MIFVLSVLRKIIFTKTILIFIILGLFLFSQNIKSYDDKTTHPGLTDEMVDFYNLSFEDKLTPEEKELIVQGSIDEDIPPRWINHFYDPVYGDGWKAENLGNVPPSTLRFFSKIFLNINTEIVSSKNWLHNETLQLKYANYGGNNTWENAIRQYTKGNKKQAYYILGHILHLLEDKTVPDHTRNDTHAHEGSALTKDGGSPYEDYGRNFTRENLNISEELKNENKQPAILNSIDEYLENLANYSNNYFFSEHTINSAKYENPKILREDKNYGYGKDKNNEEVVLLEIKAITNDDFSITKTSTLKNNKVLSSYFSRLTQEAVLNGSGVIKLFKDEAAKAEKDKNIIKDEPKISWYQKMRSPLGGGAQIVGSIYNSTTAIISKTTEAVKGLFTKQKEDPMANIANIGQIANQAVSDQQLAVGGGSQNLDSRLRGNDTGGVTRNDKKEEVERSEERAIQTQFKEVEPLNSKKEVQPPANAGIIHAPYQWPAEVIHSPYQRPAVVVSGNTGKHGNITNQFQGQFNGSVAPAVIVNEVNQPQSVDSSSAAQNDGGEEAAQNDNSEEEAAPEAPQEESQEQIDGGSTSGDLEVEPPVEEPQPESQSSDSSPEAQNDGVEDVAQNDGVEDAVQNDEEESSQDDTQSEQVANETSTESETSQSEPQPEPQPTTPDTQFYLTNYNVRSQNFTLNWQDANNIIQSWELEYGLGANFGWEILKQVQDDNGENSYNFTAQYDDLTYYFRLRGQDASGNLTEWQNLQADISTNPVVINEIAWMGTKYSSDDEWIELANKTDQEIDLAGWTLRESDGAPEIVLTGKIAPNGFYLLERTDDTTVANITADQIYTGALNNPSSSNDYGNDLIFSDADGNVVDQTKIAYNGISNFNSKMSSERVSIWADSNNQDNWQYFWNSYLTVPADAKDAGNNTISGTPKSKNSWADRFFSISSDIAKNTTLLKDRGTVKVLSNINISGGAILNIEPGTVLKFGGSQSGFDVSSGGILANGTADNKIVFTSSNDNTYGIQTGYSSPLYGDWGKINFGENTTGEFDNIIFRYSGNGTATPSIKAYKANIKISNSYFDNNKYDILSVEYSDIDIASNTFQRNNHNGITITEGTSNITGNTFDWLANPGVGIYIKSQKGIINISNNQFASMLAPIAMDYFGNFTIQGNQASGNSYNGTLINSPSGYLYDEEIYLDSDMPYFATSMVYYTGPKLKFAPGTIVKFAGALYVQGDFEAIGTAVKPIVFTKIGDDSVGGSSGSNGGSSPPVYWRAFHISGATNVAMDYFTIKHGGNGWNYVNEQIDGKCIKVFNGVQNFTFTNSTMSQCGRGLYSYTDNAQIENSTFSANSFNLESYAQTGHISNTTFGDTLVEMLTISGYQQVSY